jgi:hypothetical protein
MPVGVDSGARKCASRSEIMFGEELPLNKAELVVAKASRGLLLALCAAPVAVFPVALAYRAFVHFLL